jgi:O-antigen/teichoic acid export membrane protein
MKAGTSSPMPAATMLAERSAPEGTASASLAAGTTGQIRGSSLMLAGRLLSLVVTFIAQVVTVRYLSKTDYGVFGFALSVVLILQWVVPLGLDRADTRFLALYDEHRDRARVLGVLVLEATIILALGSVAVAVAVAGRGVLGRTIVDNPQAASLLAVLVALAPLQALDTMVLNVFAVFARPWSVFLRRYVLEPGLRLTVVAAMVLGHRSVTFLAVGYLLAAVLGVGLYGVMMLRLLATRGLLTGMHVRDVRLPVRAVFGFALPLLVTSLVSVGTADLAVIVLGHFRPAAEVAAFRAVQPIAAMNLVVMYSFTTLFTPVAARCFARGDRAGIRDQYWQSAAWIAVLTFPVFLLTTAFAGPVTTTLLGSRYAGSAPYLVLLSAAYYVNAASGFNGLTVQLLGRVRYVLGTTLLVLAAMLVADFVLIPRFGALGAATAVAITVTLSTALKQAGLAGSGVGVVDARYGRTAASVLVAIAALTGLTVTIRVATPVAVVLSAIASLLVLYLNRRALRLADTFPELRRVPLLRSLV